MKYRKMRNAILAVMLAVPMAMSYPGLAIGAQEEIGQGENIEEEETIDAGKTILKNTMQEDIIQEDTMQSKEGMDESEENLHEEENLTEDFDEWTVPGGNTLFPEETEENPEKEFFSAEDSKEDDGFRADFQDLEVGSEEIEAETDSLIDTYIAPEDYVQEGSPVKNGSGGFTPVTIGQSYFSSKYTRLGWNADTKVNRWSSAGSDVIAGVRKNSDVNGPYYVPLNNNAKRKFGFRISNVGYDKKTNTKLDLFMTCTNYQDYTYDYTGEKITGIYPMLGVSDANDLWILFKDELAAQEIKIDIVKSGTRTPVTGNYRFRWLDIDLYQRFGIKLQNGTIGHRYATKNSVVNVEKKTLFSKEYEVLTAPAPEVQGEVPENTVVYELDNSSGFYLAILRPGYGSHSIETASRIQKTFEDIKTGTCKTSAGLNWDAKGYGPVEYPELVKKTGNDLLAQGDTNSLPSSTSEYFYTIQTDVPEEHSAYYYSICKVTDTLPAGVDYSGYAAVKMLPSETDVSSWFNIYTSGDVLNFEATPAALASADFYGKTYEFQIKVKMDPTEITPAYNGDTYQYTVKNKASITCKHKSGQEGKSWSNEVTTSCIKTKNRIKSGEVKKYTANPKEGIWKTDLLLPGPDSIYQYKMSIAVPDNEFGGYLSKLEIADTLPAGVEKTSDSILVYENGQARADGRFAVTVTGKKIVLKATDAALGDRSFYGKSYDVIVNVKMVPEQLSCSYNGTVASYAVTNRFTVTTRHKGDTQETTLTSNTVADRASINRIEPDNPEKWILSDGQRVSTTEFQGREFETVFEIIQKIPSNRREWKIVNFKIQDDLENCFELKEAKVYEDQNMLASFGPAGGNSTEWAVTVNDSTIALTSTGNMPENCYGKSIRLLLRVGLKSNCSLQEYYVANPDPDILEAHIYNIATSSFGWIGGVPSSTSKNTEKTQVIIKEKTPMGSITICKTDRNQKNLKNGVFQIIAAENIRSSAGNILLKSGEVADTVTTGADGRGVSGSLYLGNYLVKEIKPPAGYTLNEIPSTVGIRKEEPEKTVIFQDEETYIRIKKISQQENGKPQEGIGGVGFLLWEKTKTQDTGKSYITDKDGFIEIRGLVPGTYLFQETNTPDGYVADETFHEFTVDENGLVENENGHTIVIENTYTKVEFLKTDKATGKTIAGAVLQLTDASGNVIDTWESEETAHRINKLTAGEYVLTELSAPSGYKKGEAVKCVIKNIPEIQKFSLSDVKMVTISVDKVLHGDEIVWAQGNPVFTFTVKGTDLDGEEHIYTDIIEFTKENTDTRADVSKRIVFTIPAGHYKVEEEKTVRYELEKIDQVVNGTVKENEVEFDLAANHNGAAVFTNKKKSDRFLTDTDFVRNVVVSRK